MLNILLALSLLLAPVGESIKVGRIFINTPYNASIIFEYAFAAVPEDMPLEDGAIDCFVSAVKATGLFTDVQVQLKQIDNGQTVDVTIVPAWVDRIEDFVIAEIALDGLKDVDEGMLRQNLSKKGLGPGIHLLRYPLSEIKAMVKDAAHEIYVNDPKKQARLNARLFHLSCRVRVIAPERVSLTITPGRKPLCR